MITENLQKKIDRAIRLLQGVQNGYDGEIEVAYSGGKDSDVILQLAKEAGIRFRAIYRDRGYGEVADFLAIDNLAWDGNIVTNPPYKYAQQFVEKALSIIPEGKKVAMFLKLTFLEGKARRTLFRSTPPIRVWVSSSRLKCAMNGDFDKYGSSAAAYAWFVWEKGYKGETTVKWFN